MLNRLGLLGIALIFFAVGSQAMPLTRTVADGPTSLAATTAPTGIIVVKFHEATGMKVLEGGLLSGPDKDGDRIRSLLNKAAPGARLERRFSRSVADLDEERIQAERRSHTTLPDLNTYAQVDPGIADSDLAGLRAVVKALLADPAVETAFLESKMVPATLGFDAFTGLYTPPETPESKPILNPDKVTPDFIGLQGYLGSVQGVHALDMVGVTGSDNAGMKVIDIEGGWLWTHEDLPDPFHESGGQYTSTDWIYHGTAVLGEIRGSDNGLGVRGITPACEVGAASIAEQSLPNAINIATLNTSPGDVILIELHAPGPDSVNGTGQYGYVPMEYWQDNFDAMQIATAAGRIVCEAAGNGQQDLDDPIYSSLFDPAVRHSGAIMCGAGTPNGVPEWFTNYGQRVDLNGWGDSVTTCGYGNLQGSPEPESAWYTDTFSGTSSASPIVVGSVVAVQGMVKAQLSTVIDAGLMRDILYNTGTPQQANVKHIGPLPNIDAAWTDLQAGVGVVDGTVTDLDTGLPVAGAFLKVQGTSSTTMTDATGYFSLGMLVGAATLEVTEYFHEDSVSGLTVVSGVTTTHDIVMTALPTVTLFGSVINTFGLPTTGARITPMAVPLAGATADASGDWSLPGVPIGKTMSVLVDGVSFMGADYYEISPYDAGGGLYPLYAELKLAFQNFSSTGGWIAYGPSWVWGPPTTGPSSAFSGSTCWGVGMNANYDDSDSGHLESPSTIFWTGDQLHLSLHYWCQTEPEYDGVQLRIKTGVEWTAIEPIHGYPSAAIAGLGYKPGWSGDSGGWVGAVFDLTSWIGQSVTLSFLFGSDEAVNDVGFFIDDITFDTGNEVVAIEELIPPAEGVEITASPNPFNPTTTITWRSADTGRLDVRIHDARGRVVRSLFSGATTAQSGVLSWDGRDDNGRNLPSGPYMVRVRDASGHTAIKRITLLK